MLRVANVSAGYSGFQALFGVSLEVNAGESVAGIGPNGAGKTTLLRLISKLIESTQGEVFLEDKSLKAVPPYEVVARGIAHVPENRRLFPRLTAEENLRMGAFTSRHAYRQRLDQVYALFPRLKERRNQVAGTLSGDEPSAGLAPVVVQSIFELVRRICSEGYTVLIVEQNIRQVLKVVSRAYLLDAGRIVQSGGAAELLAAPEIQKAYLGL